MSTTDTTASPAKTAAKKAPKNAKPYHKGNVAEDLFSAASRLIDTEGLDSLTVRRLCREVGVTAANFYNHHPSLEHLLLDVAATGMDTLRGMNERVMKRAKSRNEGLVAMTLEAVEFSVAHPDLFRVMFGQVSGGGQHERYYQASQGAFAALVRSIYGEDGNLFRVGDVAWLHAHFRKAYVYFSFFYGLARLVSMDLITFPTRTKAERSQFVKELAWTFIRGLDGPELPKM